MQQNGAVVVIKDACGNLHGVIRELSKGKENQV